MKYVIFPVWAHKPRNVRDEAKIVHDDTIQVEMVRGKVIMYERLVRSFSVGDGTDVRAHCLEADRLQKEYDEDAEPIRVYVYESDNMVPVYAGRQWLFNELVYVFQRHGTDKGVFTGSQRNYNVQTAAMLHKDWDSVNKVWRNNAFQGTITGRIPSSTKTKSNKPKELRS